MQSITIIGAGQAGLQLGIGLKKQGYAVTIVTNRTGKEIKDGNILSSQIIFDMARQMERDLTLNFWDQECPNIESIYLNFGLENKSPLLNWSAEFDKPAQSVDQRVKIPIWMDEFEKLGGKLVIEEIGIPELEGYAEKSDLVLVASGKGEIGKMFKCDAEKSAFNKPMRVLSLIYVKGVNRKEKTAISFNAIPGVGEFFIIPALTTSGSCEILFFEGLPDAPFDCWQDIKTAEQHIDKTQELIKQYIPWEVERCKDIKSCDSKAYLIGSLTPIVRHPVVALPSGAKVLGIGDTVCLHDPITGQGSNNAIKAANIYLASILEHGDKSLDEVWMQKTFDTFWDYAQHVVSWTNGMLLPPTNNMQKIMGTAASSPTLARRIANAFNDPTDLYPWWENERRANVVIGRSLEVDKKSSH
jgi:hypothetical protein